VQAPSYTYVANSSPPSAVRATAAAVQPASQLRLALRPAET